MPRIFSFPSWHRLQSYHVDYFIPHDADLEMSDDDETLSDISVNDSDTDYDPGKDSDIDGADMSDDGEAEGVDSKAMLSASGSHLPSPSQVSTCFELLSDPFADARPSVLPSVEEDFVDVHPGIVAHHESHPMTALDCFQLFITEDVVNSLCAWTNTRAACFFREKPTVYKKTARSEQFGRYHKIYTTPPTAGSIAVRSVCRGNAMFTHAAVLGKEGVNTLFNIVLDPQ